jgi:phosphoglycerate dehydrogenase-like enzyme
VWDPEPPVTGDPLIADERVTITPHVAGLTDVTYREIRVGPVVAAIALLSGVQPDPTCVFDG